MVQPDYFQFDQPGKQLGLVLRVLGLESLVKVHQFCNKLRTELEVGAGDHCLLPVRRVAESLLLLDEVFAIGNCHHHQASAATGSRLGVLVVELLLEHTRTRKLVLSVIFVTHRYNGGVFQELLGVGFHDAQDGGLVEVFSEVLNLALVAQVVASRKEMTHLQLRFQVAVRPQVLAETGFGRQLTVVRKVVVELVGLELDLDVRHVELDVESLAGIFFMLDLPADPVHCSSDVGLCAVNLADDAVFGQVAVPERLLHERRLLLCQHASPWNRSLGTLHFLTVVISPLDTEI